ncbi:MAG: hypothetical protein LBU19_00735 [Treponema sp.]|nr:hypothetical protein [Treponema sp.]
MRKPVCLFLFFTLLYCGTAAADIGLRLGAYLDIPDVMAEKRELFLTPQLEYIHTFGYFDIYAKGEYSLGLTSLYPQFCFAEERFALRFPLGSFSVFQAGLHNENDLRIDPDHGRGGGIATPELKHSLSLPPGDFSLALGTPLSYPLWGGEDVIFGLELTGAYITPFWLGFEARMDFRTVPAARFEGLKFAVNYTGDQFYGELALGAKHRGDSFPYFTLKAEFNYFFNFFILWGALEAKDLGSRDHIILAPAVGIKYRF